MKRRGILTVVAAALWLLAVAGSAGAQSQARAELKDGEGKSVGMATLREAKDGVLLSAQVKGLSQGLHAIHVHAVGKCEGPKFTSAGGHFNPGNTKHGLKSSEGPHAGDMPNMHATKAAVARYETLNDRISLGRGESSVFDADGSAVVVHAVADDDVTDPAGSAGDRVACGVITKVTPKKK